ncbi:ANTAR domain-containing response regulator [Peribacillus asahii]|uniref:Fis family transcriptional regulator n=1 Tax=Peribacillus asahii TaxID=228899 RepID=A0A3T0KTP7_9BACI|nr:response regulator [Peribacillus asahii]AZV43787.1 Fis family transcriptional regulator [Peribacillus asahii]USK87343.1 response regulator [Peribacillus asahii]
MNKRIMVVEDESIVRLDIAMMLKDAGYEVIAEAGDGEMAIELAYSLKPDLIIMDIKMPKLNGLKASEIISNKFNIPILLLTAYSQREYIDKAKQANILGYLVKPISEASLIPAIEIALKQAENANAYKEKVQEMNEKLKNRKIVEKAKGILIKQFNLSEDTAYKKMRTISMNKQVTLEKVAKHVISKYNV